jgi:aspartate carbamoyltransferase catalytic subunit
MPQLLIEYSTRFKIVFVLALDFYVYIQLYDDESTKKQNEFYFDTIRVLFNIHMMVHGWREAF